MALLYSHKHVKKFQNSGALTIDDVTQTRDNINTPAVPGRKYPKDPYRNVQWEEPDVIRQSTADDHEYKRREDMHNYLEARDNFSTDRLSLSSYIWNWEDASDEDKERYKDIAFSNMPLDKKIGAAAKLYWDVNGTNILVEIVAGSVLKLIGKGYRGAKALVRTPKAQWNMLGAAGGLYAADRVKMNFEQRNRENVPKIIK